MNINDVVFQDYQGIRRYGVVHDKYIIERWAYAEVDWIDDTQYERAMQALSSLRGGQQDFHRYVYRIDELKCIDVDKELTTLRRCLKRTKL